jgi:hypothetical protein
MSLRKRWAEGFERKFGFKNIIFLEDFVAVLSLLQE